MKNLDLKALQNNQGSEIQESSSNGELYRIPENIKDSYKKVKAFRQNMRSKILPKHLQNIVLSGKINTNFAKDLELFKVDYFQFWLVNDFKIESFSNCRNPKLKAKYVELLNVLKKYIELSK